MRIIDPEQRKEIKNVQLYLSVNEAKSLKSEIDKLLLENPLVIALTLLTVAYFIYQFTVNRGNSTIDKFVSIPKTNIIWYVLAIAMYPLLKFIGLLLSIKLFPSQFELPEMNLIAICNNKLRKLNRQHRNLLRIPRRIILHLLK